jgi:hypothetical protein
MIAALRTGAALRAGVNHDLYPHQSTVTPATRTALLSDFAG